MLVMFIVTFALNIIYIWEVMKEKRRKRAYELTVTKGVAGPPRWVETEAVVVDWVHRKGLNEHSVSYPVVEFVTMDGRRVVAESSSTIDWGLYGTGHRTKIRYTANNPLHVRRISQRRGRPQARRHGQATQRPRLVRDDGILRRTIVSASAASADRFEGAVMADAVHHQPGVHAAEAAHDDADAVQEAFEKVGAFNQHLIDEDRFVYACGLVAPEQATIVTKDGAESGPINAEGWQLGGFWVKRAEDEEEARELASAAAEACGQTIELCQMQGA